MTALRLPRGSSVRLARLGTVAIVLVAIGSALVVQWPAWSQTSYFLLTKSLSQGSSRIDADQRQTGDKSWVDGHFYSVKAPGLSALLVPPYITLKAVGFNKTSAAFGDDHPRPRSAARSASISPRTPEVIRTINQERLMVWALGIFGTVIPFLILLLLVRRDAELIAEGTGVAAALTVGLGTMLLPFSTQLFGHMLGAMLLYLCFHLLFRERRAGPSLGLLALAGLVVGCAVDVEYPMAFGGFVLGLYAVTRTTSVGNQLKSALLRGGAFASGVFAALVPLALYNKLSFGSVTYMSYNAAVAVEGKSGHAKLGLNDGGFFGIGVPKPVDFVDILLSPRGLLSISPVCIVGLLGIIWMRRKGHRAESTAFLGIVGIYVLYVSGYWLPFGGGAPGPRFLVPILPFLALGLAAAYDRIPAPTLALAVCGATVMVVATVSHPLASPGHVTWWWTRILGDGRSVSVFTPLGVPTGAWSLVPIYLVWAVASGVGLYAIRFRDFANRKHLLAAGCGVAGWVLLELVISPAIGERKILPGAPAAGLPWQLVIIGASLAVVTTGLVAAVAKRSGAVPYEAS
ncbi:MAG: hypothetical protein WCI34_04805 [Actinomycetes bacterium]